MNVHPKILSLKTSALKNMIVHNMMRDTILTFKKRVSWNQLQWVVEDGCKDKLLCLTCKKLDLMRRLDRATNERMNEIFNACNKSGND